MNRLMIIIKALFCICIVFSLSIGTVCAQSKNKSHNKETKTNVKRESDDVEIVCFGEGKTVEEAAKAALRYGIEQTYGAFVSSNTSFLNDEIVKDEITTIASGNVKKYDVISKIKNNDSWNVTIKALISRGKLVQFVKLHGGKVELDGETFATNYKIQQFYKNNKRKALQNIARVLKEYLSKNSLFDKEFHAGQIIEGYGRSITGGPIKKDGYVFVPVTITFRANRNLVEFQNMFISMVQPLTHRPIKKFEMVKNNHAHPRAPQVHFLQNNSLQGELERELGQPIPEIFETARCLGPCAYQICGGYIIEDGIPHKPNYVETESYTYWNIPEDTYMPLSDIPVGTLICTKKALIAYTIDEISKIKTISVR